MKIIWIAQNPGKDERSAIPLGRSAIFLSRASLLFRTCSSSCKYHFIRCKSFKFDIYTCTSFHCLWYGNRNIPPLQIRYQRNQQVAVLILRMLQQKCQFQYLLKGQKQISIFTEQVDLKKLLSVNRNCEYLDELVCSLSRKQSTMLSLPLSQI